MKLVINKNLVLRIQATIYNTNGITPTSVIYLSLIKIVDSIISLVPISFLDKKLKN